MTAPAAPSGSFWARRYGPLPAWGWAGIGLGVALAYSVWTRNRAAAAAGAADPGADAAAAVDMPPGQSPPWVFVVDAAGGRVPGSTTPGTPTPVPTPPAAPPATGRPAPTYSYPVQIHQIAAPTTALDLVRRFSDPAVATEERVRYAVSQTGADPANARYRPYAAAHAGRYPAGAKLNVHVVKRA